MRRVVVVVAVIAFGCTIAGPVRLKVGSHAVGTPVYATLNPSLVEGDPVAGRRAFIDLKCIDCHRVAEDPHLPKSGRADSGPMLSGLHRYKPMQIVEMIRSTKTGKDEDYLGRYMKDYAERMTTRQLVDVVAYLRNPRLPKS